MCGTCDCDWASVAGPINAPANLTRINAISGVVDVVSCVRWSRDWEVVRAKIDKLDIFNI